MPWILAQGRPIIAVQWVILLAPSFYYRATKKALPRVCEYEVPRIREPFGPTLYCTALRPRSPGWTSSEISFCPLVSALTSPLTPSHFFAFLAAAGNGEAPSSFPSSVPRVRIRLSSIGV